MDLLPYAGNVAIAFALGLVIGVERDLRRHDAGVRANALVALGAALFASLAGLVDHEGSPTRVAGQIVSGIGFLAGGVIIRDGFAVRGLNTAATLWCTAAVGTLSGAGFPLAACVGTAGILTLHVALRPFTLRLNAWARASAGGEAAYQLRVGAGAGAEAEARAAVLAAVGAVTGLTVAGVHTVPGTATGEKTVLIEVHTSCANDAVIEGVVVSILASGRVMAAGWDRLPGKSGG